MTEPPKNNNKKPPQECGLSLRHSYRNIDKLKRVWRQTRGKKKTHWRGQITLGGRWRLRKSPGLEAFWGGAGGGPWGRDEYLGCC